MAQYQSAQKQDYAALTALWQSCFGDAKAEIEAFWRLAKPTVFLAKEDGRVASMLCALFSPLIDYGGESHTAAYLYAVCTAPEYRGRGLCKKLFAFAEKELKNQADFAALVPSEASLFDFYEKLGFRTAFYHKKYTVAAAGSAKIARLDADGYRNLREMQLYGDFLSYDAPLLQWQTHLSEASGAGLYRIETEQCVCCAAAEKCGDRLIIKELLPDCPEAAAALAAELRCHDAEVRTNEMRQPFGMIKTLNSMPAPEQAYLGLAFE